MRGRNASGRESRERPRRVEGPRQSACVSCGYVTRERPLCALLSPLPPSGILTVVRRMSACLVVAALAIADTVLSADQITHLRPPDVKYVPTPQSVVDAMLRLARVTSADVVYDLGSGDGRIPITAARDFGARGVGIEIDPLPLRDAYDNVKKAGVGNRVVFLNADLFTVDISDATVVTLFLMPKINEQLIPKFRKELKRGTRIVSHKWDMGDAWPPEKSQDVDGLMIYLWTIR